MDHHHISSKKLTIKQIATIVQSGTKLALSDESRTKIQGCYNYLHAKIKNAKRPIYGINTGFGSLYNVHIGTDDLSTLQYNLIKSHACGTGAEVPLEIVKLMILLKIQSLSYGHSGVQVATVERLIEFYNKGIFPVVYEQGSLGASGDLAPLAHLCLPLIGEGEVYFQDTKISAKELHQIWSWEPVTLHAKEGLALLNGTQFMSAYGVHCLIEAYSLSEKADLIGAISLEAFDGRIDAFDAEIHQVRNQKGQIETAEAIRNILQGSEIAKKENKHTQDPYSFRCIPQVHGASKDVIEYATGIFENEINAVTDNPNIFPDSDKIISGGNFHGQPLALSLDFLTIALHELGNISERRTYQLVSGLRGLPPYLVAKPGLNSGLMIPQYTAASIVSQNKQLCTPASADSIVSSNGQEDHVSMGANAATKCLRVVDNVKSILAIELLNASQALEFRRPLKSSATVESWISEYRKVVPFIEDDRILHHDIKKSKEFLSQR